MPLVVVLFSCASAFTPTLSPEEQAFLDKADQTPLSFSILMENGEEAWSRANGFIASHSNMRITTANDYTIQTFNPSASSGVKYGYSATRVKNGDKWDFTVNCACNNIFMGKSTVRNAHIFALYVMTGELPYPKFISK